MKNNKTDNNTILIFEFINNEIIHTKQMLNKIQIKDYLIEVDIVKNKIYELKFEEFENNEYKIYDCIFYFINEKVLFTITVYFKRKNYYYCGIEKNKSSIEFIFSDFISNNRCPNLCYIEYNKKNKC